MKTQVPSVFAALADKYRGDLTAKERQLGVPSSDWCSVRLLLSELQEVEKQTGLRTAAARAQIVAGAQKSPCVRRDYALGLIIDMIATWIKQQRAIEFAGRHPRVNDEFLAIMSSFRPASTSAYH